MKKTLSVIMFCLLAGTAQAAESPWVSADYAQARLIAGAGKAGLEVRLAPGWHAYWRMPGDGGLAPQFDWSESKNLKEATVQWPTPRRYEDAELQSFGYEGQFIMPLALAAADAAQPVDLALALNLMVCEKICVPQNLKIALSVPPGATDGAHDARLAAVNLPVVGEAEQLKIENMVVGPDAMVARIYAPRGFDRLDMFVDAGDALYVTARPEVTVDAQDPHYAMVRIAAPQGTDNLFNALSGKKVSVVVTDGAEAIEREFSF